jgi:integrase
MTVKPRNGSYQADVKLGDTRYRPTFKTEVEALAWEYEARAAHALGKPIPEPGAGQVKKAKVQTLGELIDHCWAIHWASKKSGGHLHKIAKLFVDWAGPKANARDVLTDEKVHEYVTYRQTEKRNSSATINRHLSAVSVLVKYAFKLKLIPERLDMPWQDEGAGRLRYFEDHEADAIDAVLRQWGFHEVANLFVFLVDTGLRLGEALSLDWRDIRGRAITVVASKAKNHTDRTVYATARVEAFLESARRRTNYAGPFSEMSRRHLRSVWSRLRAHFDWMDKDTVVHTYRHTCASRLVQRGVDLLRVKEWMGHKSLTTTLRYAHLAPKHMEELAGTLEREPKTVTVLEPSYLNGVRAVQQAA